MTNVPVTPVVEMKIPDEPVASDGFETAPPYAFTTSNGGTGSWAPASDQAYYGAKSLKTPALTNGQNSSFNITVPAGATKFRLWYRTDIGSSDTLQVLRGTTVLLTASGTAEWQSLVDTVSGSQTLTLKYSRVAGGGNNACWVDHVEFLADQWVDITEDCRLESAHSGGGIHIKRGRPNESPIAEPTECDLVINNRSGKYTELNPAGPYFGRIGRNQPLRVSLSRVVDDFSRTVVNGMGSTPDWVDSEGVTRSGYPWTLTGTAANYDVGSGQATIQAATTTLQLAYFGTYSDVDVLVRVKVSNRTSRFGITLRGDGGSRVTASLLPGATDTVVISRVTPTAGWAFTSGALPIGNVVADTWYWMRAQVTGRRYRMRIWLDGTDEPTNRWDRTYTDDRTIADGELPTTGGVGFYTYDGSALVTYDSIEVNVWRAHTEVVSLPVEFDLSRQDRWVKLKTRGMLQRLGQGRKDLASAVTLHLQQYVPLSAMWHPLESVEGAVASNAVSGGYPALASGIEAESPDLTGTKALPGVSGVAHLTADSSYFTGRAINYTDTGHVWSCLAFFQIDALPASEQVLATYISSGTGRTWKLSVATNGVWRMDVYGSDTSLLSTSSISVWNLSDFPVGCWVAANLYVYDSGGTVSWALNYHRPIPDAAFLSTGTLTFSGTAGLFRSIQVKGSSVWTAAGGIRLTQVLHYAGDLPFVTPAFADAAAAYQSETNIVRFARLCSDAGITLSIVGDTNTGHQMGRQLPSKLLDLLEECAQVGEFILEEDRDALGLVLRTRQSIYNGPTLELDVDAGHLSDPLKPAPDDQQTRNDVTITRPDGGFARSVQTSGDLNINEPEDDPQGVGTYEESLERNYYLDSQLQAHADWRRSRGTQRVPRYPSFTMDLTAEAYNGDPALTAEALTIDSGSLVSIRNPEVSPDSLLQVVQSYEETIDQYDHDIVAVSAPGAGYKVGVTGYTTRVSPAGIVLSSPFVVGTDTSLFTRPIDATYQPWVTTAVDPNVSDFDIMVGGVRLHVNSISGTTVQTLSVDAAPVNDVDTGFTLQPGLRVTLADPWVVAW